MADVSRRLGLTGYRNYLHVGRLSVQTNAAPLDMVADTVAMHLLESENRHVDFEIYRDQHNWYVESMARCTLTPPMYIFPKQGEAPVRNNSVPLAFDSPYWRHLYEPDHRIVVDCDDNGMMAPPANLALMAALAPDFPYAEALSTRQRLVFMQQGDSVLAWVIMIDKTDGANAYRYPPQLLLIDRSLRRKLKNERILFHT
ncbi:hypothetical protein KW842_09715 [Duganella sp. sic0402]|uniref:hypothetical protein n=1 Tax=Duganella sp. sic0402 TaxID=2854786 RepID=UPI001C44EF0F|nr:hypothetical protein [Duganella sp. sic0402]MBV7536041.1 hypothetical protein [Duganella sp. sic0402]